MGVITPKNVTQDSKVQKIVCCALYSKPDSRKKSLLLDHISDAFAILEKKYKRGLHYIFSGDTNDLNLKPIISLKSSFTQIVNQPTRLNPDAILDPIIMSLSKYYQNADCSKPLDPDVSNKGKPSDHLIVMAKPINAINNKSLRIKKEIKSRPITEEGLLKMGEWLSCFSWVSVSVVETPDEKAQLFQDILFKKRFFS